jgi:hypothetical protein
MPRLKNWACQETEDDKNKMKPCVHCPSPQFSSDEFRHSQEWDPANNHGGGSVQPSWPFLSGRQNLNLVTLMSVNRATACKYTYIYGRYQPVVCCMQAMQRMSKERVPRTNLSYRLVHGESVVVKSSLPSVASRTRRNGW